MNRFLLLLLAAFPCTLRADDAVNKLLTAHDQAVQSAVLPLHRKLLAELQKLEAVYTKTGQKIALAETRAQIARLKQKITEASMPVGIGAGLKPADFKLIYSTNGMLSKGSWENGELKPLTRGFSWTNKSQRVAVVYDTVFEGAFEAEFTWKGVLDTQALGEADYAKYCQLCYGTPTSDDKHVLKVKRTAAGAITSELDGQPFNYVPVEGGRQDMHLRFMFYVPANATVEFRDAVIKDLGKK